MLLCTLMFLYKFIVRSLLSYENGRYFDDSSGIIYLEQTKSVIGYISLFCLGLSVLFYFIHKKT